MSEEIVDSTNKKVKYLLQRLT